MGFIELHITHEVEKEGGELVAKKVPAYSLMVRVSEIYSVVNNDPADVKEKALHYDYSITSTVCFHDGSMYGIDNDFMSIKRNLYQSE